MPGTKYQLATCKAYFYPRFQVFYTSIEKIFGNSHQILINSVFSSICKSLERCVGGLSLVLMDYTDLAVL